MTKSKHKNSPNEQQPLETSLTTSFELVKDQPDEAKWPEVYRAIFQAKQNINTSNKKEGDKFNTTVNKALIAAFPKSGITNQKKLKEAVDKLDNISIDMIEVKERAEQMMEKVEQLTKEVAQENVKEALDKLDIISIDMSDEKERAERIVKEVLEEQVNTIAADTQRSDYSDKRSITPMPNDTEFYENEQRKARAELPKEQEDQKEQIRQVLHTEFCKYEPESDTRPLWDDEDLLDAKEQHPQNNANTDLNRSLLWNNEHGSDTSSEYEIDLGHERKRNPSMKVAVTMMGLGILAALAAVYISNPTSSFALAIQGAAKWLVTSALPAMTVFLASPTGIASVGILLSAGIIISAAYIYASNSHENERIYGEFSTMEVKNPDGDVTTLSSNLYKQVGEKHNMKEWTTDTPEEKSNSLDI